MLHEPAAQAGNDPASEFKKKVGIRMFIAYAVVYAGFIIINTAAPKLMGRQIVFGLNLAVTYGFGLILLAIISGLIYNAICTRKEDEMEAAEKNGETNE
ncbi:MAG: DUF485 domain-containing protein [Spirochaetales bacterium]|nr:DUF485 domain-containing protein [Spirochaetales bacterium]